MQAITFAKGKKRLFDCKTIFDRKYAERLKDVDFFVITVLPQREKLYLQCNYRFEQMMSAGALHQVIDLLKKNTQKTGGVFQALGVQDLIAFIEARQSLERAIDHAEQITRNYAKRQMTWFRHQMPSGTTILQSPNIEEVITK